MNHAVTLGADYVDQHTGYSGRAVSVHYYEHGCERIVLESFKDGEIKTETFDAPRLVNAATKDPVVPVEPKTGGDRDTVGKRSLPSR
ncbi:hypothetical protein [Kribbella sp. NPDC051718]|uniref:hypothetical protein n=1 Tax=Kribbella sp. NPDC051718 TaxID=3155168 RepID=UPI00342329D5